MVLLLLKYEMEEKDGEVDDIESASSDSFIDDSDDDGPSISAEDDGLHFEACRYRSFVYLSCIF